MEYYHPNIVLLKFTFRIFFIKPHVLQKHYRHEPKVVELKSHDLLNMQCATEYLHSLLAVMQATPFFLNKKDLLTALRSLPIR